MTARHLRCHAGFHHGLLAGAVLALAVSGHAVAASSTSWSPGPASWKGDLTPIAASDWSHDRAAHLLGRAGFSGAPEEIRKLAGMTPEQAVRSLVYYDHIPNDHLQPFLHSGFWDETLIPFPPSRPAATDLALRQGESMGVRVKPEHVNRHVQPVSDRFFYWLRATTLETRRVGYWWAERMLDTHRPLEEKMALFWHGHFATAQNKVRDYRKMLAADRYVRASRDRELRRAAGRGREGSGDALLPRCRREREGGRQRELRPRGDGAVHDGRGQLHGADVREAARAFTGWNFENLDFVVNAAQHDDGPKTFLGRTGNFDGVDVLRIILEQPVTAEYIASKIYRFFVREDPSPALQAELGAVLRDNDYELQAAADDHLPVARLLQRGQLRRPHQGPGRACGHDAEAARRRGRTGRAGLQQHHDRAGPAPAEPAVGRGLGAGPRGSRRRSSRSGATSPSTTCFPTSSTSGIRTSSPGDGDGHRGRAPAPWP